MIHIGSIIKLFVPHPKSIKKTSLPHISLFFLSPPPLFLFKCLAQRVYLPSAVARRSLSPSTSPPTPLIHLNEPTTLLICTARGTSPLPPPLFLLLLSLPLDRHPRLLLLLLFLLLLPPPLLLLPPSQLHLSPHTRFGAQALFHFGSRTSL